jgi:SAM-dependent methyltransferase
VLNSVVSASCSTGAVCASSVPTTRRTTGSPGAAASTSAVTRVTAVEIDDRLAADLRTRMAGRPVEVVTGDATALPLPAGRFSSAACFTMLHHIPATDLQDRALAEIARVLRPGGLLLGTDGEDTPARRALHHGDIFEPIDPAGFAERLRSAGFVDILVDSNGDRFRFRARTPGEEPAPDVQV